KDDAILLPDLRRSLPNGMRRMNTQEKLAALAQRAIPFLRDEGARWADDGSNEPLELARDIEEALSEHGGGGEVVAWRFRVVAPNGNKGKWVLTDKASSIS